MQCPDCPRQFFSDYHFRTHLWKIHKKELKLLCEFCSAQIPEGSLRKQYCSKTCQQTASRRRTSARLGIPPNQHDRSPLNPLFFD